MSDENTQSTRRARFMTPLGPEAVALLRFDGSEGINTLFHFTVHGVLPARMANPDDVLGRTSTVIARTASGGERHFCGIVTEIEALGEGEEGFQYAFTLRPWLWVTGLAANSRIFKGKTPQDILAAVWGDYGTINAAWEFRVEGNLPAQEYIVQYRESDLAFSLRLMARFGLNYHFEMRDQTHVLIVSDSADGFRPIPGDSRRFVPVGGSRLPGGEHIDGWSHGRQMTTGRVTLGDYDFTRPTANMTAERQDDASHPGGKADWYDLPGGYTDTGLGRQFARRRHDAARSHDRRAFAEGDLLSASAGQRMKLEDHPEPGVSGEYVLLACSHSYAAEAYRSGGGAAGDAYSGRYELLPKDSPLAPPPPGPHPNITGAQTAVVIGEGEIDCDKYGRILVRFHWDRDGAGSMRCRVAQAWAGKAWGSVFIPRVGMEVLVEFLEGDPDRPLVVGCLYNGANTLPLELPGNKTVSGIKSRSSEGGGGYNALLLEDKKGQERIDLHAERDLKVMVKRNETREVKNKFSEKIGATSAVEIGADSTLTVKASRSSKISQNDVLDVGQELLVEAGTKIILKVGRSTIEMDPMSIKISAMTIEVNANIQLKTNSGAKADHTAGAMMIINAPLVKIN